MFWKRNAVFILLPVFLALACAVKDETEPKNTDNDTTGDTDTGDTDTGDTDADTDTDTESDTNQASGCEGIDFLFVVDDSKSMEDEQANLIASFPGFMDAITKIVDPIAKPYNIMVVDSDACYEVFEIGSFNCNATGCCADACAKEPLNTCLSCSEPSSGGKTCQEWLDNGLYCDRILGAGSIGHNVGNECNMPKGKRYFTLDTQDPENLNDAFACAAHVGCEGYAYEEVLQAGVDAVTLQSGKGKCNEGFLRKNAILVLIFITDEETPSSATSIFAAFKQAKGGNENAIVTLGIFGDQTIVDDPICENADPETGDGADPAPVLESFLNLFPKDNRFFCSVCLKDYISCFSEVTQAIKTACDEIIIK